MTVIRYAKDRYIPFTQVSNDFLNDSNLSCKTKGFICFCIAKPANWKFYVSQLTEVLKEGRDCIRTMINEGIEQGYIYRYSVKNGKNNRFESMEYIVSDSKDEISRIKKEIESPEPFEPETGFPLLDNPGPDLPAPETPPLQTINNTNKNKNNNVVDVVGKKNFEDKSFEKQDVIEANLTLDKKWTEQEIAEAWKAFKKNKNPVSCPINYIEAIIENQRIMKKNHKEKVYEYSKYKCKTSSSQGEIPRPPGRYANGIRVA